MSNTLDQGFRSFKARPATTAAPYNPFSKRGDDRDTAYYVARPGVDFLRPWLAIRNGIAYQWPLGIEGFELTTEPWVGLHRMIGDNEVEIDVLNTGEERIELSGNFPGDTAPVQVQMLREVVRRVSREGKILYIPEILPHAQNVQVLRSRFTRGQDERGRDFQYQIEFGISGLMGKVANTPRFTFEPISSSANAKGKSPRTVKVDAKHNTIRKVAAWKLKNAAKWRVIYDLNELWFVSNSIAASKAPDYRIPVGTVIYF